MNPPAAAGTDLPLVSVIIPVRNDAKRLGRLLQSVRQQSYPPDRREVIVVDNGSQDDSRSVGERQGATVLSFPQLYVGALRNRGVAVSNGSILAFVDSDHEVPPDWIETAVAQFAADPGLTLLGFPYLAPPDGTWVQRTWELHRLHHRGRREANWLASGNMFARREAFLAVNGFREDLVATEDVDLCIRLRAQKAKIIEDVAVANVHHGEPVSLAHFFRKEFWRGTNNLRGFIAHRFPWHELPSIVYPVYHLLGLAAVGAGAAIACSRREVRWVVAPALAVAAPSLLLALRTAWRTRSPRSIPGLAALYFTYGVARAAALFR